MAYASPFSRKVLRKASPALAVILLIFVSLMFLIRYTDAFFLVILLWIVIPVLLVKAWRRLRDRVRRGKDDLLAGSQSPPS